VAAWRPACASLPAAATVTLSDGSQADLVVMHDFTVQNAAVLALTSCAYPRPMIFAVLGSANIEGNIDLTGSGTTAGPGGFPVCNSGNLNLGPGGGGQGFGTNFPSSSAGGGSFCGAGGTGVGTGTIAPGGNVYGVATLIPIAAGSGGGYLNNGSGYAGPSGGALQISAAQSLTVGNSAAINAGGGDNYGGGGAGGGILL
jgi:hypothetical protein